MKTYLQLVAEFHEAFRYRQPEPVAPDLSDKATNELRPKLIIEELHEFKDAIRDNNRIEQLDALCDLQYVLSGAVLAWGYRRMFENHKILINLSKIRDMDGHIAAMMGFTATLEIAAWRGYEAQVFTYLEMIQRRLTQTVYNLKFQDVFGDAFAEVHRSNLSKIWKSEDVEYWKCSPRSDTWIDIQFENTSGGYIGRRADGKIIKSPSYSPADLARFVK